MTLLCRLGIISDPHITLPETIATHKQRFHLVEVSLDAFESAIAHLEQLDIDVLLLPGDLTQDGEHPNHHWLQNRLAQLAFPAYVVPGNHDVIHPESNAQVQGLADFPVGYAKFGYDNPNQPYYCHEIVPGVTLVGLNSNQFDAEGRQLGTLDAAQLRWLQSTLASCTGVKLVMVHHNAVEHLPDQQLHPLGQRYILDNAPLVRQICRDQGVALIFTGHLHVQDIAEQEGVWEITTGSLVSYPHPYRVVELYQTQDGLQVRVESFRIESTPQLNDLGAFSREWIGERSLPFMKRLVQSPPLGLSDAQAEALAQELRYFWPEIAAGDRVFRFPEQPDAIRQWLERFSATTQPGIDNHATLILAGIKSAAR